jgi:hypothetical protein
MRPIEVGLVACALAAALPASAQVYRWVDERGVINYAAKPPGDGRAVVRLDLQESRVSVIPTAPRPSRSALPPTTALSPVTPGFPSAIDQTTVGALQSRYPDWRARCIAERRVDCDNPSVATFDHVPSLAGNGAPGFGPFVVR